MPQDQDPDEISRDVRGVAASSEVADLVQAIRSDDRDWAADRRALNVQALVRRLGRGGRGAAAEFLGVSVSAIDQTIARARTIRPSLTVDWTMGYRAGFVEAGEFQLDPSASQDDIEAAAVAAAGYPTWQSCTRHHDDWEDRATLRVQRRSRPGAMDSSIVYEATAVNICLSCGHTPSSGRP